MMINASPVIQMITALLTHLNALVILITLMLLDLLFVLIVIIPGSYYHYIKIELKKSETCETSATNCLSCGASTHREFSSNACECSIGYTDIIDNPIC